MEKHSKIGGVVKCMLL